MQDSDYRGASTPPLQDGSPQDGSPQVEAEVVAERERTQGMRVVRDVWHIVLGDGDSNYQPILCGGGINLPGPSRWGKPTCPNCIKAKETS